MLCDWPVVVVRNRRLFWPFSAKYNLDRCPTRPGRLVLDYIGITCAILSLNLKKNPANQHMFVLVKCVNVVQAKSLSIDYI